MCITDFLMSGMKAQQAARQMQAASAGKNYLIHSEAAVGYEDEKEDK